MIKFAFCEYCNKFFLKEKNKTNKTFLTKGYSTRSQTLSAVIMDALIFLTLVFPGYCSVSFLIPTFQLVQNIA
jgi:hypothetical protein